MNIRVVSVNCSPVQTVVYKGKRLRTGIFKNPILGPARISKTNMEGDRQADLRVHGGVDKAIYSYDLQNYDFWRMELDRNLNPGAFGENLTTEGLPDTDVSAGDTMRVGTAILEVSQPRLPCYKLGVKFEDELMPKRFVLAARWGIYFRVIEEGTVEAGDGIEILSRDPQQIRIADLGKFATGTPMDREWMERALAVKSLSDSWKNKLRKSI